MKAKQKLGVWLEGGDLKRVIDGLLFLTKREGANELEKMSILQSAVFHHLNKQKEEGTITDADYEIGTAKSRQKLHAILAKLPYEWTDEGLDKIPSSTGNADWKIWLLILLLAMAVIVTLAT